MRLWNQVIAEFERMTIGDQTSAINKDQMEWLVDTAQNLPCNDALDLGFGRGFSAIAMEIGGCNVTCINYESPTKLRRLQAEERYERICGHKPIIINLPTDQALPRLHDEGKRFGLIFIDAGHRFDDVFIDTYYSTRLCAPGGIMAIDDTYYGAIRCVANWINSNLDHLWVPYQILDNTISWRRTDADADDSMQGIKHRTHTGQPKHFGGRGQGMEPPRSHDR